MRLGLGLSVCLGLSSAPAPAPTVSAITPSSGLVEGETVITNLAGTGFATGATVTIGGASATSVVVVSSTKITCVAPAGTAGVKSVVVTNTDAQSGTGAGLYTYTAIDTTSPLTVLGSRLKVEFTSAGYASGICTDAIAGEVLGNNTAGHRPGLTGTTPGGRPAITFDGVDDELSSAFASHTNNATLAALPAFGTGQRLAYASFKVTSFVSGNYQNLWEFPNSDFFINGYSGVLDFDNNVGGFQELRGNTDVSGGSWFRAIAVYDELSGNLSIYLNGSSDGTPGPCQMGKPSEWGGNPIWFGSTGGGSYFSGCIERSGFAYTATSFAAATITALDAAMLAELNAPAPTVTSASPSSGLNTATTAITITGTNFLASPTVTVGGVAATSVVRVNSTTITCVTPIGTVGAQDIVVTNTDTGVGTGTGKFTYAQDPAALTLAAWFRGSFSASPWNGVASAGGSGSAVMSWPTAGEIPVAGTAVNTFTPASFDGVNDMLRDPSLAGSDYLSVSAYTILTMVKPSAAIAADANAYVDQQLFCVAGDQVGISWSTSGVRAWHFDGTDWTATAWKACSADAWHSVCAKFSGGVLSISVDDGTAATVSKGNVSALSSIPKLGRARNAGAYTTMQTMELITAKSALSAGTVTGLINYFKNRYPSAGLP